jgi:hypothetical protein
MTPKHDASGAQDALARHATEFILEQDREVRRWRLLPNGPGVLAVRYPDVDPDVAELAPGDTVIETHPLDTAEAGKTFIRWRSTLLALAPFVRPSTPVPTLPRVRHKRAGYDFPCALHKGPAGDCNEQNCRCN